MTVQDEDSKLGRRRFLFRASASAVAAGVIFPACGPVMMGSDASTEGGASDAAAGVPFNTAVQASTIMVGSVQVVTGPAPNRTPIVLGRDGMGYYAMTGECTHEQCPVVLRAAGTDLDCTCTHGSRFSFTGELTQPATVRPTPGQRGLDHYFVSIVGGVIQVTVGMVVPSTTRVTA